MKNRIVFISYSHDSDKHREKVLALSERLRADGIDTRLDQYISGSPEEGWPRWMLDQLDEADSVLVICTETYYRRFRGHEEPGKGKGVDWEGMLITQETCRAIAQEDQRLRRSLARHLKKRRKDQRAPHEDFLQALGIERSPYGRWSCAQGRPRSDSPGRSV